MSDVSLFVNIRLGAESMRNANLAVHGSLQNGPEAVKHQKWTICSAATSRHVNVTPECAMKHNCNSGCTTILSPAEKALKQSVQVQGPNLDCTLQRCAGNRAWGFWDP